MGKSSKATKKFQKNHLGRELTKRKHDQKKKQIREKSLAKYAPKEDEEEVENDEEEGEAAGPADETDVFHSKAKSKPRAASKSTTSAKPAVYTKPAPKKAPVIEDLDVDQFMDGSFLEGDDNEEVDDEALDEEDGEEGEDEDGDQSMDEEDEENNKLLADIEAHEAELANLAQSDPDFFQHLQKTDKELLRFSKKDIMHEDEPGSDEEVEDHDGDAMDAEEAAEMAARAEQEVLTMASLTALQKQVRAPTLSIKALKKLVRIFRSAVHIGAVTEAKTEGAKKKTQSEEQALKEAEFRHEVRIDSPKVFHELIRFVLKEAALIWDGHFKAEGANAAAKNKTATTPSSTAAALDKHSKWNSVGPILKAFLGHLLFFLGTLKANASNEQSQKMLRFVLGSMEGLVKYFEPFPKFGQKLLKELLEIWATSERNVRIDAFLRIRQLAIELTTTRGSNESMLELVLKGIYLTYVRHTKFTSALTLPVIEFMANCVVEIYGIDPILSYQHAFVYIRQLAIHLRQSLQVKKKDSYRMVYNWNFINCLRVWSKVLSVHGLTNTSSSGANGAVAASDNLSALVYPYVQIALGTLTVLPSSRYFPLRFHVSRFLIDLSSKVKIFIPLTPYLLSIFNASEFTKKPISSTRKVNEIQHVLKVSKHVIATKTYQEAVVNQTLALLLEYFNIYSYSIAYPELILPTLKTLKKVSKDIIIHRIRKQIQSFILKLEHNSSWIATKRNGCNYAPKDMLMSSESKKGGVDGIDTFKNTATAGSAQQQIAPLEKYVKAQIAEQRLLDDVKADWNGSKTPKVGKKKKADSDDEEEEDERKEKYDRQHQGGDDDEDEDMEGDEEDEGEDEDGEDEEDDEQPRKKSKSNGAAAVPRQPFEYPSDDEYGDGDVLEELAFSDDEDDGASSKKKKAKKQTTKSAKSKPSNSIKKESTTASNKKPGSNKSAVGEKRKRT